MYTISVNILTSSGKETDSLTIVREKQPELDVAFASSVVAYLPFRLTATPRPTVYSGILLDHDMIIGRNVRGGFPLGGELTTFILSHWGWSLCISRDGSNGGPNGLFIDKRLQWLALDGGIHSVSKSQGPNQTNTVAVVLDR